MIKLIKLGSLSDFEARLNFRGAKKISFNPLKHHVNDNSVSPKLTKYCKKYQKH